MTKDRPAGDVDYARIGQDYARRRRADPRIAARIWAALADARSVLNVGAGTGNYEPTDRVVVALEPAATMRAQRAKDAAPCVIGVAGALPFDDGSFDAVMAVFSLHQWPDARAGLREMRRVARRRVVVVTFDPAVFADYWQAHYLPALTAHEADRFHTIADVCAWMGGPVRVDACPIPADCTDGFNEAFFARPERMLEADVRGGQSLWAKAGPGVEAAFVAALSADLQSGEWDRRFGHFRSLPEFDGSLRILIAEKA